MFLFPFVVFLLNYFIPFIPALQYHVGRFPLDTEERRHEGLYTFLAEKCLRSPFLFQEEREITGCALNFHGSEGELLWWPSTGTKFSRIWDGPFCPLHATHSSCPHQMGSGKSHQFLMTPLALCHFPDTSDLGKIPLFSQLPLFSSQFRRRCPDTGQWK